MHIEPPKLYQTPNAKSADALRPTFAYLMETEVHVYALAIAASVMLSFFPFLIVMVSLCKYVFAWPAAVKAVYSALADTFPGGLGQFIQRNLTATVEVRGFQVISVILLLFTANGIFVPLEVALNRVWRVPTNRSYARNQLISLGLIFVCGSLALGSFLLTALSRQWGGTAFAALAYKIIAMPVTILALFFIYWKLPNRDVPASRVIWIAVFVGAGLEMLKLLVLTFWPAISARLQDEYGPFYYSASLILWSFCAAMIVLAGAEWSARRQESGILE